MPIEVQLTEEEYIAAREAGIARYRHHRERKGQKFIPANAELEALGVVGELVVAKLLDTVPDYGVGSQFWGGDDVAGHSDIEVKTVTNPTYRLLVYANTPDAKRCVLVYVDNDARIGRVIGWISAAEGKKVGFWMDRFKTPCYAIPTAKLVAVNTKEDLLCCTPPL